MGIRSKIKNKIKPIIQQFQNASSEKVDANAHLEQWRINGRNVSAGDVYKRQLIKTFASKFKIKSFVETGTFLGGTVEAVLNMFSNIYSVEVEPKLYADAKEKFKSYQHVNIINGDSAEVIKEVLANLTEPALFWLDAHYSAGVTGKGKEDSALRDEVHLISEHIVKKGFKHVMLLDDARLFFGVDGYPTVAELIKHVSENLPGYTVEMRDDIVRIYSPIKGKLIDWN